MVKRNKDTKWDLIFQGIEDGERAFCGPSTVQLDITDRCNNTCIGCWVHSPLLNKNIIFPDGEREVPFERIKSIIDELSWLGTQEIILSGSGEPFMHPDILDIIKFIKSKGMYLTIITNGTLLDERISKILVNRKVDLLTVSVWAGRAETYRATHSGKDVEDFYRLKDNLKKLSYLKKCFRSVLPYVKIYNVICGNNYCDIESMVDFAIEVDANSVEFQPIDIIRGYTESLSLDEKSVKVIIDEFRQIMRREDFISWEYKDMNDVLEKVGGVREYDVGKIWKNYKKGFVIFEKGADIMCPRGVRKTKGESFSIDISPLQKQEIYFRFLFDRNNCFMCDRMRECFPDGRFLINVEWLNMLGIPSFVRRLFSPSRKAGIYEKEIISFPCYMGWYYLRILTDGSVIPCCKAARHPLGNIYRNSIGEIWSSNRYREFRLKAKTLPKNDAYFSDIDCVRSCDNVGMNIVLREKYKDYRRTVAIKSRTSRGEIVYIKARGFKKGDFNATNHEFGEGIIIDGGKKKGYAEYEFFIGRTANYRLFSCYASLERRGVEILIDNVSVCKCGLNNVTDGWTRDNLRWFVEKDSVFLREGKHILQIISSQCIPHIYAFAFVEENTVFPLIDEQNKDVALKIRNKIFNVPSLIFSKVMRHRDHSYITHRIKEILGIYDGTYAYKGPFHVQIDITNNCNNQCIACWCNSPLLGEKKISRSRKSIYLPTVLVKEFIDEVYGLGATEIYFSGSGEPLMHPEAMEIFRYAKSKKGLVCHVNTNFTLMDRNKLDSLIQMGMDYLTVSIWAATPKTYVETHIGRREEEFLIIKDNLRYLNINKKSKPHVKIYNVLFNMNYFEMDQMIDFAKDTGSESVEFTLVDTIPGKTDKLILNEEQREKVYQQCMKIRKRIKQTLPNGAYLLDNGVAIFGFDQFLRRISKRDDVREAKYDKNIIDSIPCYIGWLFARLIPEGEIHSCLKAHRIPVGSIYLNRFSEIWNSPQQMYFRKKTLVYKKEDSFFRLIGNDSNITEAGCYKSCDDILRNMWMHRVIRSIPIYLRVMLKIIAQLLKYKRAIRRFVKKLSPSYEYRKYHPDPLIAGIIHGRKAFVGPQQVVIDVTNRCNLRCIACWLYSPLLKEDRPSEEWLNEEISLPTILRLINDLASLGTKRIRFTGGGEPFMHKDIMRAIEYARKRRISVSITTNFGLLGKKDIKNIVDLGVDELCISIWASNRNIYIKTHPNSSFTYFERIKENLMYLKEIKNDKLRVTFANVIMKNNVEDFENMYEFGKQYGADCIYFTLIDVFPLQTDSLLLNEAQRQWVIGKSEVIRKKAKNDHIHLEFFEGFLQRISIPQDDFMKGEYDKNSVNLIPCYVGWTFTRILADGSVVPCCRGVKKTMGNIRTQSFRDIWFSPQYNEFRARAKYQRKDTPYFKEINCIKECDNLMHNKEIHRRLIGKKNINA